MNDEAKLHEKNCIPCKGGIPPLAISEIHKYVKKVDGWDVKQKEKETYFLEKKFALFSFCKKYDIQKCVKSAPNQKSILFSILTSHFYI